MEGEENKLTIFSTWTIVLGCNESNMKIFPSKNITHSFRRARRLSRSADDSDWSLCVCGKMELNLKEVPERLRFDEEGLRRYLERRLPGFHCQPGQLAVRQFSHGESNPTYHLSTGPQEFVLRRRPPGKLLPGAHRVRKIAAASPYYRQLRNH